MESHPTTEAKAPRHLQVIYGREYPWNTAMELDHVARLGRHRPETIGPRMGRSQLLRNYIQASRYRNWGNIDGERVMAYACSLLHGEQ